MKKLIDRIINGLVYLQTPLKAYELSDERLVSYGIMVKELEKDNQEDLKTWVDIINNSYDDCEYDVVKAKQLLSNHPYLDDVRTFLFKLVAGGSYFATVSIGKYKNKSHIGSAFRFGVHRKIQGKGYGRLIILYAYSKLQDEGVKYAETIISFKRKQSLYLHYSIGFKPQLLAKYITVPIYSKFKKFNFILTLRLKSHYNKYLKSLNNNISR